MQGRLALAGPHRLLQTLSQHSHTEVLQELGLVGFGLELIHPGELPSHTVYHVVYPFRQSSSQMMTYKCPALREDRKL